MELTTPALYLINMKRLETRAFIDETQDEQSRTITGRAIVFDSPSRYIGYTEYIRSSAITQELIDNSDIIFNYNHDDTRMLARWTNGKGTLDIQLKDDGVYFSFEAPETELGNEVLWHVRHGNLTDCSFAFTIEDEGMRWFRNDDNELCGEVVAIDGLYDMTICSVGAYADTSVSARDFDLDAIKRSLDESQTIVSEEVKEVIEQEVNEQNEERSDEKLQNQNVSILNHIEEKRKNILNYIR